MSALYQPLAPLVALRVVNDFAGIDMPGYALSQLVRVDPHWCFEVDPAARRFLIANHPSAVLGGSVVDRDAASSPFFDIVVAGFPCQPFSDLGKKQGWHDDQGRGTLVTATLSYVRSRHPKVVILKNVAAFWTMSFSDNCMSEQP